MIARHDAGLDPHDLRAAGVRAGRQRRRPRRRAGRDPPDPRRPGDPAVHRRRVPGDARLAGAAARRVAARRDVAAARVEGVGVAVGPHVRHARRGQGCRQAVPAPPHRRARRPRARGHPGRHRPRRHPCHRPDAALMVRRAHAVVGHVADPDGVVRRGRRAQRVRAVRLAGTQLGRARRRRAGRGRAVRRRHDRVHVTVARRGRPHGAGDDDGGRDGRDRLDGGEPDGACGPGDGGRCPVAELRRPATAGDAVAARRRAARRAHDDHTGAAGALPARRRDRAGDRTAAPRRPAGDAIAAGVDPGDARVTEPRRDRTDACRACSTARARCVAPGPAPSSTSCATTCPTTRSVASTGPRRCGCSGRSSSSTAPSATRTSCSCSTTGG